MVPRDRNRVRVWHVTVNPFNSNSFKAILYHFYATCGSDVLGTIVGKLNVRRRLGRDRNRYRVRLQNAGEMQHVTQSLASHRLNVFVLSANILVLQ